MVSRMAQITGVQRSRIVEKPIEVDQLNRINEFLELQKIREAVQISNVNRTNVSEKQNPTFGSNNALSIYNQPTPAFNKDFFIAYYGINSNQK